MNKHFSVRCSDWEAENLSDVQVKYAAQDAIASVAICLKLIAETRVHDLNNTLWSINNMNEFYTSWTVTCAVPDTKFRMSSNHKFVGTGGSNSKGKKFTSTKPNKYCFKSNYGLKSGISEKLKIVPGPIQLERAPCTIIAFCKPPMDNSCALVITRKPCGITNRFHLQL